MSAVQLDQRTNKPNKKEILAQILDRLEKIGDLPIFSASVNRIQVVSSNPDSDAMALAMEVLKDANLTAKVLKLANSPYYNRGVIKVGTLSRAIVMLGFKTVKSTVLTMKLIDSFQQDHPSIDMNSLLINSFMSAGFVREVATECGAKDAELSYVCGLLHNLGEVITAYTMPELYIEMKDLVHREGITWSEAQKKVLGFSLLKVGQAVVEKWEFPANVSKTIAPYNGTSRKIVGNKIEQNKALACLTNRMMDLLYSEQPVTKQGFAEVTQELSNITGVSSEVISGCLDKSFKQSCDLASAYGLDKARLKPKVRSESGDDDRDRIARKLSFYASNKKSSYKEYVEEEMDFDDDYDAEPQELVDPEAASVHGSDISSAQEGGDTNAMLEILHELTTMMTQGVHLNTMFTKVLEGMHRGVGFDRAALCLLSPDHKSYTGRLAVGQSADELKQYFKFFPIKLPTDLFSKLIMEGTEVLVPDVREAGWVNMLPPLFSEKLKTKSFLAAAVRVKSKPIGMFYVDKFYKNTPITSGDRRGFMQLVAQAQLALQMH